MKTIIDASFAVYVQTSSTAIEAARRLPSLAAEGLIAPVMFWFEVASALRYMSRRGGLTQARRSSTLVSLEKLGIVIDTPPAAITTVIDISDRYQLTIYDAAYLELALRSAARLATRDGGLATAARKAGIDLVPG